jgi:midasin (ATPase involved in ribosome maturation)
LELVRQYIPLHSYLIHFGYGLVFVKYNLHLLSSPSSSSMIITTTTSSWNADSIDNQQSQQQALLSSLIQTVATRRNMSHIATAMLQQHPTISPILLAGPDGCGKSSLIREFANAFFSSSLSSSKVSNHRRGRHNNSIDIDDLYKNVVPTAPLLEIHIDDETDTKTLVGSYTATETPGEFEWRPGALTTAVQTGQWVVFENYDTVPLDIQASLEPLYKTSDLTIR